MTTAAKNYYHDITLLNSKIVNLPASYASGHAVEHDQFTNALGTKQDTLSIAAGSQNLLQLSGNQLSVKNLLISSVEVDTTSASIAAFVAASYTAGNEFQEGDVIILTAPTPNKTFIHNGGTAGDVTDFTEIETGTVDTATIRAALSAGSGISYNSSTGVISIDSAITTDISNLQSDVSTAQSDISSLQSDVAAYNSVAPYLTKYNSNTVNLVGGTAYEYTHGLGNSNCIVQCRDSAGHVLDVGIYGFTSTTVMLLSNSSVSDVRVVVIG